MSAAPLRRGAAAPVSAILAAIVAIGATGCASTRGAPPPAAAESAPTASEPAPVAWDPAVLADFEKDVPRFVKAMARTSIEDMARERGTNYVDRALYDEALAKFKR